MSTDFRALCAELIASWDADGCDWKPQHQARWEATVNRARAALAEPECREPAAVTGQPRPTEDDVEDAAQCIYEAMRFERVETTPAWSELGNSLAQDTARKAARAVLAHWGNPAPAPPADGEVAECTAELEEQKPRPDYDRVQKIATEAQIRSAAQYLAKKQHCDGDLIPAIRYAIARWGNPTPQPPADGEVVEVVEWLHTVVAAYKSCRNTDHIWSLSGNGVNARLTVTLLTRAAELLQRQVLPEVGE